MLKVTSHPNGVNPFFVLFFLYLISNFFALITMAMSIPIAVDGLNFTFSGRVVAISALLLFLSLFACLALHQMTRKTKVFTEMAFGQSAALLLAFLQLAFLFFNTYYGQNIAGIEDVNPDNLIFRSFFSAVQPDLIFLIMSVGIRSNRWFWLNAIIYGVSLFIRGWSGGFYLLAVIWTIRKFPISINSKNIKYIASYLVLGLILLPFIISYKWFIRDGGDFEDALTFLQNYGYANYLVDCLSYVTNRFQHLGHVAMLAENSEALGEAYDSGAFIPYYLDAVPQWLVMKMNGDSIVTINKFIVQNFMHSGNHAYATNPGIAGWVFALQEKTILFCLYLFGITFIPSVIFLRYAGYKYFLLINCFILIYLFHGWIGAYVNLVLYTAALRFLWPSKNYLVLMDRSK